MKKRAHLIVHGDVQGVGLRYLVRNQAKVLNITGWIINRDNGTVELVAEGEESDLKKLIEFCRHGPRYAKIEEVKVEWQDYKAEFHDFSVRY